MSSVITVVLFLIVNILVTFYYYLFYVTVHNYASVVYFLPFTVNKV